MERNYKIGVDCAISIKERASEVNKREYCDCKLYYEEHSLLS